MTESFLERIILRFPEKDDPFRLIFSQWIQKLGTGKLGLPRPLPRAGNDEANQYSWIELTASAVDFYPKVGVDFSAGKSEYVNVDFALASGEIVSIRLENVTGEDRKSPHVYSYVKIEEVIRRFESQDIKLVGIDHAGCNLPWFAAGLHPQVRSLRSKLAEVCLYHRFPTGEAWDFILPGSPAEIERKKTVDYERVRRPKFEIVSFEKSSIPMVQFDVQLNTRYETLLSLFPETLNDPDLRNLWIYLENPYNMDVCIVANEVDEKDWSAFFKDSRLANPGKGAA